MAGWTWVVSSLTSVGGSGGHALPFIVVVGAHPCSLMVVVVVVRGIIGVEGVVVVVG